MLDQFWIKEEWTVSQLLYKSMTNQQEFNDESASNQWLINKKSMTNKDSSLVNQWGINDETMTNEWGISENSVNNMANDESMTYEWEINEIWKSISWCINGINGNPKRYSWNSDAEMPEIIRTHCRITDKNNQDWYKKKKSMSNPCWINIHWLRNTQITPHWPWRRKKKRMHLWEEPMKKRFSFSPIDNYSE